MKKALSLSVKIMVLTAITLAFGISELDAQQTQTLELTDKDKAFINYRTLELKHTDKVDYTPLSDSYNRYEDNIALNTNVDSPYSHPERIYNNLEGIYSNPLKRLNQEVYSNYSIGRYSR